MSYNTAGPVGTSSGTSEGPGTMGHTTDITQIIAYAGSSYIYGLKLYWGMTNVMYGSTNGLSGETINLSGDPVKRIKYHIDATGILRGIEFKTVSNAEFPIGYLNVSQAVAFNNTDNRFTDLVTYKGTVNGTVVIWGATFYYTGTAFGGELLAPLCSSVELAWPALAVLAHTAVVAKSLMKVGKLRGQLGIKAPSCEPPLTTGPSDSQLWYRTFRAQENCKEMFLVYLPSILIASTMGYHAFGKWAPRAVGTLAFVGACFRFKYLKAYCEDADKRGPPFYYASLCMKPIFFIALASCGYLIGKEVYHHCVKRGAEEDDE